MKRRQDNNSEFVFSTGDDALSTLGEELRQKYPEMMEKFARLQGSDPVVRRLVDTVRELLPYEWQDSQQFYEGAVFCVKARFPMGPRLRMAMSFPSFSCCPFPISTSLKGCFQSTVTPLPLG